MEARERYPDFLAARRELLADAANTFLDSLYHGQMPEREVVSSPGEVVRVIPGSVDSQEEEQLLIDTNTWVSEQGLPEGEFMFELVNAAGEAQAVLDLAWPNGLQEGLITVCRPAARRAERDRRSGQPCGL